MVYLDVYNSIFEYLEKIGIVDDVFEYSEEIIGPLLGKIHGNDMRNDLIAEFALYHYEHKDQPLIEFLSENLYPKLDGDEKEEFDLIMESERLNLKFKRKEKLNELDTKRKELYNFYFEDMSNGKTKIIVSSTPLDELGYNLNARLINNPNHKGKYSIIGGIYDKKTFESIEGLSLVGIMQENIEKIKSHVAHILKFSKEHNLEEISKYKNEKSSFLEQDRKIMKINRLFFEKFDMGFDDFLNGFFELSNNGKFVEMAEYYLSIDEELKNVIFGTNYLFLPKFLFEKELIKGFVSFIKKDSKLLEQSILELEKRGKKEFGNILKTEISLSREEIIKNNKKFLSDKVAPLRPKGYDAFIKNISNYSPDQIKEFLRDVVNYLEDLPEDSDNSELAFFLPMTEGLLDKAEDIPYLDEIKGKQKEYRYIPEEFYEYIDADDEVHDLFVFLSAAYFADKQDPKKAYGLIIKNKIIKTKSFDMIFFVGKIFSFFDNKKYKSYFNQAKKINKERYKKELETFLNEKEQKKLYL